MSIPREEVSYGENIEQRAASCLNQRTRSRGAVDAAKESNSGGKSSLRTSPSKVENSKKSGDSVRVDKMGKFGKKTEKNTWTPEGKRQSSPDVGGHLQFFL